MIERFSEQFGTDVGEEYKNIYDGLMASLIAIRDFFADSNLPLYVDFFDSTLIPHLQVHDCAALLGDLDTFEQRYNSFQQYRALIREEVERLSRIQQRLDA